MLTVTMAGVIGASTEETSTDRDGAHHPHVQIDTMMWMMTTGTITVAEAGGHVQLVQGQSGDQARAAGVTEDPGAGAETD